ncbi:MAG: DNA cytosine methyltransferase [Gammaproteobacteria bacterium]|nr:DNA cytosine methyltransferase [Gammaproteobacteria bacterium]
MTAVDLFAGWGGFTAGAEAAGVRVRWAANHWPLAVEAHARNHPRTEHACQDLRQADWSTLPDHDLLLASPACQGHSRAAQPSRARTERARRYHDSLRATAWAVVDCAEVCEPRAVVVENVPDFRRWKLYPIWRSALELLGYHLQEHLLTASRMGAPQRRERLFIVATRSPVELDLVVDEDELPFGPCVEEHPDVPWRPVSSASLSVQDRIAAGRSRFGRTFLTQHISRHRGVPLDEPIRTITTCDQWALVDGDLYRPLTIRENARAMGFPDNYHWPSSTRRQAIKGLGNAVCPPVAQRLVGALAVTLGAA